MSRAWRIEYEGALYHLLSRGNEGRGIFEGKRDLNIFLNTIGEFSERFEIDDDSWKIRDMEPIDEKRLLQIIIILLFYDCQHI